MVSSMTQLPVHNSSEQLFNHSMSETPILLKCRFLDQAMHRGHKKERKKN